MGGKQAVPVAVVLKGAPCAVAGVAVHLDDDLLDRPVEVHGEPEQRPVDEWGREAALATEGQEALLELAAGGRRSGQVSAEDGQDGTGTGAIRM